MLIPFFGFRIMVGMGLIMLAVSWFGNFPLARPARDDTLVSLGNVPRVPTGFIAILCGWFTAEVGRQPWVVYGLLRTKDAVTPSLTTGDVLFSLALLRSRLRRGLFVRPVLHLQAVASRANRRRESHPWRHGQATDGVRRQCRDGDRQQAADRRINAMEPSNLALFWAGVIACAILLYVILDGLDLGVGVLFGTTKEEAHRAG